MTLGLFSKDKPTQRVDFEGGFVELQHLSKGVKNEYQARMAKLFKDIGVDNLKNVDEDDIPEGTDLNSLLEQVNNAEVWKLSKAIQKWSEDAPINEDTVYELDEEVFDKLSEQVDEMNKLKESDKKN